MGVPANAVAVSGDGAVYTGACIYRGFSFRETTGAATATIKIYDGTGASGTLLDSVQLSAGESAREWYGEGGLRAGSGIYVDVTGTVEGSVRVG